MLTRWKKNPNSVSVNSAECFNQSVLSWYCCVSDLYCFLYDTNISNIKSSTVDKKAFQIETFKYF